MTRQDLHKDDVKNDVTSKYVTCVIVVRLVIPAMNLMNYTVILNLPCVMVNPEYDLNIYRNK